MSISYSKLNKLLNNVGLSANALYLKGVITEHTAQQIRKGSPVNIKHIASICHYLNVPIEDVVEVIQEDQSE